MYVDDTLKYTVIERTTNEAFQSLWLEIEFAKQSIVICGVVYKQHNSPERFLEYFEEAISRYSASGKLIYLCGDFNINILKAQSCNFAQEFLNCVQSYGLLPTIDKPTRVYNNSATLIDNIFINKFDDYFDSGNIVSDLTDHFSQFCSLKTNITDRTETKKIMTRDFSKFSEQRFLQDLSQIDWSPLLSNNDIDKVFSTFYNKLNKFVNKHAPFCQLSKRKIKQLSKPWITNGLRRSIKIKNELFFSGNQDKYKIYRNKTLLLTRINKRKFYHSYFERNISNMKRTWEGINNLINKKKRKEKIIHRLKKLDENIFSSHQSEIPDILNKHFATIGHQLASKIPPCSTHFSQYLPQRAGASSFLFHPVLSHEIQAEIMSLPVNKALGLYSCPVRILKLSSELLACPLVTIINKSVDSGTYPSKLKHAKIIPIFKSDDDTDPNNYRPISLLSISNRIFE